VAVISPEVVYY